MYLYNTLPPHVTPLSPGDFECLWGRVAGSSHIADGWRQSYASVVCRNFYFTSAQAAAVVGAFSWSHDRVAAAIKIFGRIVDPHNADEVGARRCKLTPA